MKNLYLFIGFAALIGCKSVNDDKKINLEFTPATGTNVSGTASFIEKNGKVTFTANLKGMTPGVHAIHIHENAECSGDFKSAGGHWNPTFKKHGKWGDTEHHKGDIGNFTVDASGNGTISLTTDEWCIGCNDDTKNIMGKSLIVHEKADDYVTQPTGDAGGRQACSAIIK
jgi:Cu-Zn family superoxide dismutase